MIALLLACVLVGLWLMRRRARAAKLAGLDQGAPVHTVSVGPRTRRISPLRGERL